MTQKIVQIEAVDSLLFRDARPFSNELGALTARSLTTPMPGTIAGFIRTFIGNQLGWDWEQEWRKAQDIRVHAPLLLCQYGFSGESEFILPAPADALIYKKSDCRQITALRPFRTPEGLGCDLPHPKLLPLLPQEAVEVKPEGGYNLWRWRYLQSWLLNQPCLPSEAIAEIPRETRVHVAIDPNTGTSKESQLYTVEYRAFEHLQGNVYSRWSLLARVYLPDDVNASFKGFGLLGGERRVAHLREASQWLDCPELLRNALSNARYVRMMLATPAIFEDGWKPGWLDSELEGVPPCAPEVRLRLVAAAVKRREAVSGWDYARRRPKPVRWLAPAGSVYFFELVDGSAETLAASAWLQPVSDKEAERDAGYGLALWGVWESNSGDAL
jgi:CRISPR-associated protein Cmr3